MDVTRQDQIVLMAYGRAGNNTDVYGVIDAIVSVCADLGIRLSERPLESKRERATTRLRQAGLIEKTRVGGTVLWNLTEAGKTAADRMEHLA